MIDANVLNEDDRTPEFKFLRQNSVMQKILSRILMNSCASYKDSIFLLRSRKMTKTTLGEIANKFRDKENFRDML